MNNLFQTSIPVWIDERQPEGVAQSFTLLYRRVALGRRPRAYHLRSVRTTSGVKLCDTAEWNSALLFL
jgi:hypothetical protein